MVGTLRWRRMLKDEIEKDLDKLIENKVITEKHRDVFRMILALLKLATSPEMRRLYIKYRRMLDELGIELHAFEPVKRGYEPKIKREDDND
jgi:hypothetical protein